MRLTVWILSRQTDIVTKQDITMMTIIIPPDFIGLEVVTFMIPSCGTSVTDGTTLGMILGMDGICPIVIMATIAGLTGDGAGIIIQDGIADGVITDIIATLFPTVQALPTATMVSVAEDT